MELSCNSSKSVNILFVEDDKITKELIRLLISRKFPDVAVSLADDAESGIELCRDHEFDIVITDINMPDMDGIQMAEEIKAMKPATKFIVMSGYNEKYFYDKLKDIGITDYILKPVDTKQLFLTIAKFIAQVMRERHKPAVPN